MTDKTHGRAIGAVGPGDVKKLNAAGLTVVDADAYIALRNTAALAKDLEKLAEKHRAELDHARRWARAWKATARSKSKLYRVAMGGLRNSAVSIVAQRAELDALRARIAELEAKHDHTS